MAKTKNESAQNPSTDVTPEEQAVINETINPGPTVRERFSSSAAAAAKRLGNVGMLLAAAVLGALAGAGGLMLIDGGPSKATEGVKAAYAKDAIAAVASGVAEDVIDQVEDDLDDLGDKLEDDLVIPISRENDTEDRAEAAAAYVDDQLEKLTDHLRDRVRSAVKRRVAEARDDLEGPWYTQALSWVSDFL